LACVHDGAVGRNGVFSEWQPRYSEHGIAVFPVGEGKKPLINGWQKVGLKGSAKLAGKFTGADALGYVTGGRSNVTVLDIDTTDEKVAEDAIGRHGQPGIVTRTASGKLHLLYRYNGERRRIRPWPGLDIDVLGDNGYALAAPSKVAKGSYEIIHGHLDDLDQLKPMVGIESTVTAPVPAKFAGMREGDGRNRALWERCMWAGHDCTLDRMMDIAREANKLFKEPMMDAEVVKVATSAWRYDVAGLNFFTRPRITLDHDVFDSLGVENPDALFLFLKLKRYHGGNDSFVLSKAMATSLGWGYPRFYAARALLERDRLIRCIKPGGRGPNDPPIYGWAVRG